jgi:inosine-uridine nucleoside N-ribohydrolase
VAVLLLLGGVVALSGAAPAFGAEGVITARGAAAAATHSTKRLTLTLPGRAKPGDVLLAWLGLRRIGPHPRPNLRVPNGWKLVSRTHKGALGSLAVYWHVVAAGETRYTWTTSERVGGVAFIAAFRGVDTLNPIDASQGAVIKGKRRAISTPSVTTTVAGDTLVSSYFAHQRHRASPSWRPAGGMRQIRDAANSTGRSGSLQYGVQATAGPSGQKTARASAPQDDAIAVLTALRPATPVPLIVDTDIFSDADDVGALATAFALQIRHEARVIAIGVNTRINRPAVATNSWKCAAAVAQFYGSAQTPIGTDMPNNGTELNTADFVGPCATLASPATPVPLSAVSVFRRALVGQADGSVVIAESGYSENLAALISSPGDAISPLSGRDLIAKKVKLLMILAGGYPSRSSETNLAGNPAAAQAVAANWPTKVVWSGYEIGDALHTGDTISRVHPSNSPVRVSYEAFVGPKKWTYSYDLIAVYYAVRPGGSLVEHGPGTNTIDSNGGNAFTPGAGNQYYLTLTNAASVEASLEALLDTLPGK